MRAIHQLTPVVSRADAVGGVVLSVQQALRDLGYDSRIFAQRVGKGVEPTVWPASSLRQQLAPGDVVLYHLSIGSSLAQLVATLPARLAVAYHNITPPHHYAYTNAEVVYWLLRGRFEMRALLPRAELVLAFSQFSAVEARNTGARVCHVVAPAIDVSRLSPAPACGSDPPLILHTGRIAPNKRQDVLLRALAVLRHDARVDARLVLAGSAEMAPAHLMQLRDLARRLGVSSAISMSGQVLPDRELGGLYRDADVFATASEHEGLGVPLVEAMAFSLPVVAYAAAAVPETVDGAGLLLPTHDPDLWAAAFARILKDGALRARLAAAAAECLPRFSMPAFRDALAAALFAEGMRPS